MNEAELLDLVEREVEARQPEQFRLNVNREGVRRDGSWWYVVVSPSSSEVRASDYNSIMVAVENAIEDAAHENVLLIPTLVE